MSAQTGINVTTTRAVKATKNGKKDDGKHDSGGMNYLQSMPRRWITIYIPLGIFVFILLFPFYWMVITAFKPDAELLSRAGNPFLVIAPTLAHFKKLLFDTAYPSWMWNTVIVSTVATFTSLAASVFAAYAIERLRFQGAKKVGLAIFLAYLIPPSMRPSDRHLLPPVR